MTQLVPCPNCAELLHVGTGDCPWCARTDAAAPTRRVGNLMLVSLGLLTLAEGCLEVHAIYGHNGAGISWDTGLDRGCPQEQVVDGEPVTLDGTPLELGTLPEELVSAALSWDPCAPDTDSDPHRQELQAWGVDGWWIEVGGHTIEGSGDPRLVFEEGEPTDRLVLEDGALDDGVVRTVTVDAQPVPDLVIRLEIAGDADLSSWTEGTLPLVDAPSVTRTLTLADSAGTLTIAVDPQP